eukprot:758388-Hanusia_phi.AAC.8
MRGSLAEGLGERTRDLRCMLASAIAIRNFSLNSKLVGRILKHCQTQSNHWMKMGENSFLPSPQKYPSRSGKLCPKLTQSFSIRTCTCSIKSILASEERREEQEVGEGNREEREVE